jgi:chemotaxis protein methyltransferase CheR
MVAHNALSRTTGVELKILATDISHKVVNRARLGIFEAHRVGTVPPHFAQKYLRGVAVNGTPCMQVTREVRKTISFANFNLMASEYPFRHGFDVIFCRNVMIYFDRSTQERLVAKFTKHLHEGGYLIIGHSESLTGMEHALTYVEPTVYRKP